MSIRVASPNEGLSGGDSRKASRRPPDDEFSGWLTAEIGVAPVPGSSFFHRPEDGQHLVRFAFCKTEELLKEAAQRLESIRNRVPS